MKNGKKGTVSISTGENGTTFIRVDPESFDPEKSLVLTEASIESVGERLVVTGNERTFDRHWDQDDKWFTDLSGRTDEYVISPGDLYAPPPRSLFRRFDGKPQRKLRAGWYMRRASKPVRIEIGGNFVLVDQVTPGRS